MLTTFRQVCELFAAEWCDKSGHDAEGLDRILLRQFTSEKQHPRHTYQALLNRLPDIPISTPYYVDATAAARHFHETLLCSEFLMRVPELLMTAFPEAPRIFFVHIPKTAGTSVRSSLQAQGHFVWDVSFATHHWLRDQGDLGRLLDLFGQQARHPDRPICLTGHFTAAWLIESRLVRSFDRVFTTIRRPTEIVLSAANYALMVMASDLARPDAQEFAAWLAESGTAPPTSPEQITPAMIEALIRSPTFSRTNSGLLVRHVSQDGTLDSAMEVMATLNMDVVDVSRIQRYVESCLGVPYKADDANASVRYISKFDDLSAATKAHVLGSVTPLDNTFYELAQSCMRRNDRIAWNVNDRDAWHKQPMHGEAVSHSENAP